jgi:hypothetical protein
LQIGIIFGIAGGVEIDAPERVIAGGMNRFYFGLLGGGCSGQEEGAKDYGEAILGAVV